MGVYKGVFNKMNEKRFEVLFYGDVINCVRDENGKEYNLQELISILMDQQATINELQSIINHIKCKENCEDYDYCCETVCSLYNEIKHLKEENEQLKKQIQIYEQLISNSYVGEEETLDGFVGKYVIWENELQKYKEKIKKVIGDE